MKSILMLRKGKNVWINDIFYNESVIQVVTTHDAPQEEGHIQLSTDLLQKLPFILARTYELIYSALQ